MKKHLANWKVELKKVFSSMNRKWLKKTYMRLRQMETIVRKSSIYYMISPKQSDKESCLTLWDPMDCSLPGSSVHGILQARILEWGAISFSRRSSQPRDWIWVPHIVGRCITIWDISPGGENRQIWGEVIFEETTVVWEFSKSLVKEIQLCACVSSLSHC